MDIIIISYFYVLVYGGKNGRTHINSSSFTDASAGAIVKFGDSSNVDTSKKTKKKKRKCKVQQLV